MSFIRQTSFAAGELSPYLYGRTDLELFGHGARKLSNFFVNRQGNAVSRPGTKYVASVLAGAALAPYLGGTGAYLLVFSAFELRVRDSDGASLAAHVTPYAASEVAEIQYAQAGDVMILTHAKHPPYTLFLDGAFWRFYVMPTTPSVPGISNAPAPLPALFRGSGGTYHARPLLLDDPTLSLFVSDAAHPPKAWQWRVSTVYRNAATGVLREGISIPLTHYWDAGRTITSALPADNLFVLALADKHIQMRTDPAAAAEPGSVPIGWTPVGVNYYRGRMKGDVGLFGFIGSTRHAGTFKDEGIDPDFLLQPLRGESPFRDGTYPAAVGFFQARLVVAGGDLTPSTWRASATDAWQNWDAPVGVIYPTMPLETTLVGRKRERIVSMLQQEHLLVFTDSSVWAVGRSEVEFTPGNLPGVTRVIEEMGSLPLLPLAIDGSVLYARAKGRGVRELRPTQGGFEGQDASWQSEHLFRGVDARIVSWCYQRDPHGVAWVVLSNGTLLSCTHTSNGWAWAKHPTGPDSVVISVASLPGTDGDIVFLVVRRSGDTFLERMVGPAEMDAGTAFSIDSHIIQSASSSAVDSVLTGLGHLEGKTVWAVASGYAPQGPLVVSGGKVTVQPWEVSGWPSTTPVAPQPPGSTISIGVGLPYTCDLELLDAKPGSMGQKTIIKVGFEVDNTSGLQVGEDFAKLVDWQQRTVTDSYEYPSAASALVVVNVKGSWRKTGRAVLRQARPLPVTVLGITRELSDGG